MRVYLDASVIVPTLVDEAASPVVDRYLKGLDRRPIVSDFSAAEVASVVSRLVRTGQLKVAEAQLKLSEFDAWCVTDTEELAVHSSDIRLSATLVRRFDLKLRAPDALHIAACRRLGVPLVTLDRRLSLASAQLSVQARLLQ